ncbi:MAG: alpha/beta hydrolase [Caldilineaceae bacterium]
MFRVPQNLIVLAVVVLLLFLNPQAVSAQEDIPEYGAYAEVNGIEMYYEVQGEGEPLLLIHGAMGSTEDFAAVIPAFLDAGYQTIAFDCRGRGRSTDSGVMLSYAVMAEDTIALMDELGIETASIAGQSDGAMIGLHLAIHYPDRIDKLISYGANFNVGGLLPANIEWLESLTQADMEAMFGADYRKIAPDPDHLPVLFEQLRHMFLTQPNFTVYDLMGIEAEVLVFDGEDEDTVRIDHARQMAAAIPNSSMVILPGTGHHLMYEDPETYLEYAIPFLAGELDASPDGRYAAVNNIAMYYEIHGEGEPVLLMPSGMWSTADFADLTERLAQEFQVIVVDARGRGQSTDSGERLDFTLMADDVEAFMDALSLEAVHLVGWADSAVVGLDVAMRYPKRVDKLVAYAPNYTVDGLAEDHRAWLKSLSLDDMFSFFGEAYARTAPDPSYLPAMSERIRAMFLTEPNYTLAQLATIRSPVLILDGENDEFILREHLEEMAEAMPTAELAWLPDLGHYAPFDDPEIWTSAVLDFLNEP